ncbi:MAG: hypothetical protein ACKPJD_07325, partial [Planctomycetaceae bacterium]
MNWRRMLAVWLLLAVGQDVSAVCVQNSVPATPVAPARALTIPRALIPALRTAAGAAAKPAADEVAGSVTGSVAAESGAAAATTAQATAAAQARTQLLQKLEFDRRPSAILAAWAGPAAAGGDPVSASAVPAAPAAAIGAVDPDSPVASAVPAAAATDSAAAGADPATAEAAAALQQLQQQLQSLKTAVTRGSWPEVGQLLSAFSEQERLLIHEKLVTSLTTGPSNAPRGRNGQRIGERNLLRAADVIAIAELYPVAVIPQERLQGLGQLATTCENEGESPAVLAQQL